MAEFISINDAKIAKKGSISGTIISAKDAVSKENWSRKDFILEDKSGSIKLTVWGEDIPKFKLWSIYEIEKPQYKTYNDEVTVSPSKFGSFKCTGVAEQQAQLETPEKTAALALKPTTKIPALESSVEQVIGANTLLMIQIEHKVRAVLTDISGKNPDNGQVGLYTKMNFYFLKGMDAKD